MSTETDRIEKKILLRAPRSRVYRALTDAREFGVWLRVKFDGAFAEGARIRGNILHPGYEHITMEVLVERIEAERLFSFRWHPYAIDPEVDYASEPMTLVEFRLSEVADGTELTVVESGFDRIPLARRAAAFRIDDEGWAEQVQNLRRYVAT